MQYNSIYNTGDTCVLVKVHVGSNASEFITGDTWIYIVYEVKYILTRPVVNIAVNKIDIWRVRYHFSRDRVTIVWSLWRHQQSIVTLSAEPKPKEWDTEMMCEYRHFHCHLVIRCVV